MDHPVQLQGPDMRSPERLTEAQKIGAPHRSHRDRIYETRKSLGEKAPTGAGSGWWMAWTTPWTVPVQVMALPAWEPPGSEHDEHRQSGGSLERGVRSPHSSGTVTESRGGATVKAAAAPRRIAFLGGYLPRLCGIATFTHDLCEAVAAAVPESLCFTGAVNDRLEGYDYPPRVRFELDQKDLDS